MRIALTVACVLMWGCGDESVSPKRGDEADGTAATGGDGDSDPNGFGNPTGDGDGFSTLGDGGVLPDGGRCQQGVFCEDDAPDSDDCGSLELGADVETIEEPGNVLVIFDRSGSMDQDWNGTGVKWQLAGQAVIDALTPVANQLTVGAVFFPSPDANACAPDDFLCAFTGGGTCGVNPITAADQITFKPGPDFLTEFGTVGNAPKFQPVGGGRTPLTGGVIQGGEALAAGLADGTLTGTTSVIIITDGSPNCSWDEPATNNLIASWQAQGIKSYVVGLPGAGGAATVLDTLAVSGATTMHITPADSATLAAEVQSIVLQTVSIGFKECVFDLDPAAAVPDDLHLVVNENGVDQDVGRDLGAGGGWSITPDGVTVTLTGNLCDSAKAGIYESILFKYGCVELPPLPPPDPVVVE